MNYTVEHCTAADFAAIAEIENEYIETPWSAAVLTAALSERRYTFFKATVDGKVAGYIGAEWIDGTGEIQNLAVRREYRRIGMASALIAAVRSEAARFGANRLILEVNELNAAAIALYIKCGFTELSRRARYYGENAAVVMQASL